MIQTLETTKQKPTIIWEKLPQDFILPDDPVENIYQPLLASALTEALGINGFIQPTMLIASNMATCAKLDGKTIVKAPDWFYVPQILPTSPTVVRRSYTPNLEGEIPLIVMEFLSETDSEEYSVRPIYPYGKMWFYEQILQVPIYVIFESSSGMLEVRQLQEGHYELQSPDEQGRYPIQAMGLSLGVWYGQRFEMTTHWLRWWDNSGNLLLWGSERIAQEQQKLEQAQREAEAEKQRAETEKQRAEAEKQRAEQAEAEILQLREQLRKSGISETEL